MTDSVTGLGTEMDPLSRNLLFTRNIFSNIAHKLIVGRKRSREQITSDYDQGEWLDTLHERRWESCKTLEDYVFSTSESVMTALIDGCLSRITVREYYKYRAEKLEVILRAYCGSIEKLVEIGSGAGRNLIALALTGRWHQLHGLEISSTGREVTRQVAIHYDIKNVTTSHIDLLDTNSVGFGDLRGATAFSFYCLEQLPAHTRTVMLNLLSAGVSRVVHIEPTPELFSKTSLRDLATVTYIWRQNYQRSLVQTAMALEKEGLIRILKIGRLNFAPTCRNDPTLVVWEPSRMEHL